MSELAPITEFKGINRFLSNFAPEGFWWQRQFWWTSEHAFQGAKIQGPQRSRILLNPRPEAAKAFGREHSTYTAQKWDAIKTDVMLEVLRHKFARKDLGSRLLRTGNAQLIEGNTWNDTFWGVCNGVGQNYLGKILMQVREEIRLERSATIG